MNDELEGYIDVDDPADMEAHLFKVAGEDDEIKGIPEGQIPIESYKEKRELEAIDYMEEGRDMWESEGSLEERDRVFVKLYYQSYGTITKVEDRKAENYGSISFPRRIIYWVKVDNRDVKPIGFPRKCLEVNKHGTEESNS